LPCSKTFPPIVIAKITASSSGLFDDQTQPNVRAIAGNTKEITIYLFRAGGMWNNHERAVAAPPPPPSSYRKGWMKKVEK
jgi:hypothetical protein